MTPNPHTTPSPEDLTTRVLHGLGTAQPAPDFEARLLHALAATQQQQLAPTPHLVPLLTTVPSRRWFLPFALAAVAAVATLLHTQHMPHSAVLATGPRASAAHSAGSGEIPASPQRILKAARGQQVHSANQESPFALSSRRDPLFDHKLPTPTIPPRIADSPSPSGQPQPHSADLALAEATAPSQPPPPLPITTEERQIQRFASRHTAFDLAALAPAAEPAHEAADRQAFQDFFEPPSPTAIAATNP